MCISSRLLGIILPSLIILILIINILREENSKSKKTKSLLFFLFLFPLLTIIFWPYLWENPIDNFLYSFKALSDHDIDIYNFYLGEYVLAKNLPWHYSLVWIFITTPFLYLVLFLIGFVFITRRFFKRLFKIEKNNSYIDLWRSNNELYDLIFYLTFLIPIFVVIDLNSTLYDGWRHLYFIYPSMLMISIYALNLIKIYFTKRKNKYLYSLILICVLPTLIWMYKYHPYQNIYFNFIAGKNFNENFEMDYWGLSNRESLEYIAERSDKKITVANISTTNLNLSKKIISKELRNKIIISNDLNNSDYIVNNYRNWNGNVKPQELIVPSNYKVYYQIKVDGVSINTIYKKK